MDLFAADPGAFDHLAVDLARELTARRAPTEHAGSIVVGEAPTLPNRPVLPDLTGLIDFSRVDHALGILLDRGHTPLPAARELLESRARRTGSDVGAVAAGIVDWF